MQRYKSVALALGTTEIFRSKRVDLSIERRDSELFECCRMYRSFSELTIIVRLHKAGDFEGPGGPEDKKKMEAQANPGSDAVRENIR